ncbi:MAG TPA: chorismate mutase [Mucilaginibacter sp.]
MKVFTRIAAFALIYLFNHNIARAQSVPMETTKNNDQTLKINRDKIDSLDKKLIELLGLREQVVKDIGIYKAKNNIPSLQPDRFKQVLEKNIAAGKEVGLSETFVSELMNAIHKESLRIEDEIKKQ